MKGRVRLEPQRGRQAVGPAGQACQVVPLSLNLTLHRPLSWQPMSTPAPLQNPLSKPSHNPQPAQTASLVTKPTVSVFTNSLRKRAAVIDPPRRPPEFFRSAGSTGQGSTCRVGLQAGRGGGGVRACGKQSRPGQFTAPVTQALPPTHQPPGSSAALGTSPPRACATASPLRQFGMEGSSY